MIIEVEQGEGPTIACEVLHICRSFAAASRVLARIGREAPVVGCWKTTIHVWLHNGTHGIQAADVSARADVNACEPISWDAYETVHANLRRILADNTIPVDVRARYGRVLEGIQEALVREQLARADREFPPSRPF